MYLHVYDPTDCTLCPRRCHGDRTRPPYGYCQIGTAPKAALASVHQYEEPPISGTRGSGTVFFSGCALRCVFCQNYTISQENNGVTLTTEELADTFLSLQEKQVHNLNLVTAGHFLPSVVDALRLAKEQGLTLPVVYNSSGYETVEALSLLEGLVDIYLPDCKYYDTALSAKLSHCPDYFFHAAKAIGEMVRQVGEAVFDETGLMQRGVIIRHMVLPSAREDSKQILSWIKETFGDTVYVSLLRQYTPMYLAKELPPFHRKLTTFEYEDVVDHFLSLGLTHGFRQEKSSATSAYTPLFDGSGLCRRATSRKEES